MSPMRVQIAYVGDEVAITYWAEGAVFPLMATPQTHANFDQIKAKIEARDENGLEDMFRIGRAVTNRFERVTDRVTLRNGRLYYDGDEIHNSLVDRIIKDLADENEDWEAWALFLHYLQENPSQNSKDQLYTFVEKNGLDLTPNGDIIFYKGVNRSTQEGFDFESTHSGPESDGVLVDGVPRHGHIPQNVGCEVTMPRSVVKDNPSVHCSTGLHVANKNYASTGPMGGNAVVEVHVNPRDVVSVPTDYSAQKVRVCRYTVASEVK